LLWVSEWHKLKYHQENTLLRVKFFFKKKKRTEMWKTLDFLHLLIFNLNHSSCDSFLMP
jgi:hypothetical protein